MPRTLPSGGVGQTQRLASAPQSEGKKAGWKDVRRVRACRSPAGGMAAQMRSSPWELRGWLAPPGRDWALEPLAGTGRGPNGLEGRAKRGSHLVSGGGRQRVSGVWEVGSGWDSPGRRQKRKATCPPPPPRGQAHGLILKTTNMNGDCFLSKQSAACSRKQAAPGYEEKTTGSSKQPFIFLLKISQAPGRPILARLSWN